MLGFAAKAPGPVLFATSTQATPDAIVRIPVVVTDRLGRYISGLEKEHFKLLEEGVEQQITEFSSNGRNEPLSLAVVHAIQSVSVGRGVLLQAISQFKSTSGEFWLIYGSNGRLASPVRVDQSGIVLDEAQAVPLLSDGIVSATELMKSAKDSRKVILIISDGNGRIDSTSQDQIRVISSETGARIYAVSLTPVEPAQPGELAVPALLDAVAASSGGRHFRNASLPEVQDVLVKMEVETRNTYLIGFVPGNTTKAETFRRILVEILPPRGIPSLSARSTQGYFPASR
jgi:Ca-activated chloride channel family protein